MKKSLRNKIALALWVLVLAACSGEKHAGHSDTYTCPMHPTVVSDKPGTCPVCGMDLVRKTRDSEEVKITEDLSRLLKSPNESVVAGMKSVRGEFKSMTATIKTTGIVTYDTRKIYTIASRMGGRLEKVYLKYIFQHVGKGERIAEIYSPELVTAQRELLYLVENDPANSVLIDGARTKLSLLGATQNQVDGIIKSKGPFYTFSIYSPYDGYVISSDAAAPSLPITSPLPSTSSDAGMGMSASSSQPASSPNGTTNSPELMRVGSYVSAGQTIFKIVNPAALWVELNLAVNQSGLVKVGDVINLNLHDGQVKAKVDFVQPFLNKEEEFIKIRVYLTGQQLRIGQLVEATIQSSTSEVLWLPEQAVLDLGMEQIAFIKDRGSYKPRKIETGIRVDGWVEVKQGVLSADEVAADAQYLVDSESFIKSK